jgi:O-antigen/teichoic acid export membrane protein
MAEMDSTRLVKGSTYLATQSIVTTLIGAVALAFNARILTQEEMGVAVVLTLTLGLAQVLTDVGFSGGLTKYVACRQVIEVVMQTFNAVCQSLGNSIKFFHFSGCRNF